MALPNGNADPSVFTTRSLEALQSDENRKVMDLVDELRRSGLSSVLQLPQIVVCGDQSSGKSSVLEAITEIPFPRKENLCTRFATEVVLRNATESSMITKITAANTRTIAEKKKLEAFEKCISNFSELPNLIDEATSLMGLGEIDLEGNTKAFSKDVVRIEISGPGRPQLTVVDLPGLIHSENKSQTEADVQLIHDLVETYISSPRTIILAVISAKNDYANQIILKKCRQVDKNGRRTLGIITKPDFLRAGSENEQTWIDLARNKDIKLNLGWHMLRNRGDEELGSSFSNRNAAESLFFGKGGYAKLPSNMLGIESLRIRLSRLLNDHLKRELPNLRKELSTALLETCDRLDRFGEKCSSPQEQRQHLIGVSMAVHDLLKNGVSGQYERDFFGSIDTESPVASSENIRRLRAVVQHLNIGFSKVMRLAGHKYNLAKGEYDNKEDSDRDNDDLEEEKNGDDDSNESGSEDEKIALKEEEDENKPIPLVRSQAIDWVLRVLRRSRGKELPGDFNPLLISQLFWEQSEKWEQLASNHVDTMAAKCAEFVRVVLCECTSPQIHARLSEIRVEEAMAAALSDARKELHKLILDKQRSPVTYNHYYTSTIQRLRSHRQKEMLKKLAREATTSYHVNSNIGGETGWRSLVDPGILKAGLERHVELNMDRFSAEEVLDRQAAYYKIALKYFVDVVTTQVIERHLVDSLSENVISPKVIGSLSDQEIHYIVAEPEEIAQERAFLETRKKMLEGGQETFRRLLGGFR